MALSIDSGAIMPVALSALKTLTYVIFGGGFCIGLAYYLFILRLRKVWETNIWEKKADGRIHLIARDKLLEKKINKGKQVIYWLKFAKAETLPPPWEAVYRWRKKEYVDYLRVADEYVPMSKDLEASHLWTDAASRKSFMYKVRQKMKLLKEMDTKEVQEKFVFIPLQNSLAGELKFQTMDYDVNLMRINALENRDRIYADKKDWLEKYGQYIAFAGIIVLIIVVLYMSYNYSENIIGAAMSKAESTLSMVEALAEKIGGTAPA